MMMMIRLVVILSFLCVVGNAFLAPAASNLNRHSLTIAITKPPTTILLAKDKSRSGTKRDRLNKLAELEDSRVETDKSFVGLAAGGFVGLILLLLAVAFASGVLDPVSTGY
jgi:hypothetical protein